MKTKLLLLIVLFTGVSTVLNAQVTNTFKDDVYIQGSLGIGTDIDDGQGFNSDTFIMKENTLRMLFDDTSTGSFPSNDWRFTFNSDLNGGANYFSIDDVTAGAVPFRIDENAGNNALYIESGGHVGMGNTNPSVELHITGKDTPSIRLDQTNAAGWVPQVWDIGGNEQNFFIRDVTQSNGGVLPFKIKPGSPTDALTITKSGTVGVGTFSPNADASLHMTSTTQGLLINRMTTSQRNTFGGNLVAGDNGMMVYDSEENKLYLWDGTQWTTTAGTGIQDLTSATVTDNLLTIAIENGNSVQVDLSPILTPLQEENTAQQAQIDKLITEIEALKVVLIQFYKKLLVK